MNLDILKPLAQRLASNPAYLVELEEAALRELLLHHSQKLLDADLSREVEEMIRTNPLAASIWKEFQASDEYLKTEAGRDWLQSAGQRILSNVLASRASEAVKTSAKSTLRWPLIHILSSLRDAICELFVSRASLATASGNEGMERTLKDGKTRVFLKPDSAGRLWLQVTSTADEFAGKTFQVGVQPTPALLSFSEVAPGVHDACVCVSDELAAALSSGAELKLTPFPQT